MEIVFFIGGLCLFVFIIFAITEDIGKEWAFSFLAVYAVLLIGWLSLTSPTESEVEIHTATTDGTEWRYYVNENQEVIPVANNTKKVVKVAPRKGSIELVDYEVIVE